MPIFPPSLCVDMFLPLAGSESVITIAMSSYVQSPCCLKKTFFPCSHPLPQALSSASSTIFPSLARRRCDIDFSFRTEHYTVSYSLQMDDSSISELVAICRKKKFL